MARFNLIDEEWISVIVDRNGKSKKVSISELFKNSHNYYGLAGESKTQDFAVMRFILAIMHTVFSRFDENGKPYPYFKLGDRYEQISEIEDEEDIEEYAEELLKTWSNLWRTGHFSKIILEYLEKWHDRFYLFDENYPFFQVRAEDISEDKINKSSASEVMGKNINRLISESGNKIAMFSPKSSNGDNKDILSEDELARWLLTYQGYVGLSDKVIFGSDKYKSSKGWLFDIGGLYLLGSNLFETLMLNCVLVHPELKYMSYSQKPSWEFSSKEIIKHSFESNEINNIAQLYTSWSRAIYIDPDIDMNEAFKFQIVKMPDIEHKNQFLEPMTVWNYNDAGENKDAFTPRKHKKRQSLWRSYGLITISYDGSLEDSKKQKTRKPDIVSWFSIIKNVIGEYKLGLEAVSMQDDGNATSWVPVDEIYDSLNIYNDLILDTGKEGWVYRINDVVELTKRVVDVTFKSFVFDVAEIRNLRDKTKAGFISKYVEQVYYLLDKDFKIWISEINSSDSKEEKISVWKDILKNTVLYVVDDILKTAGPRDFTGIETGSENKKQTKNIATAYSSFKYFLNKEL